MGWIHNHQADQHLQSMWFCHDQPLKIRPYDENVIEYEDLVIRFDTIPT